MSKADEIMKNLFPNIETTTVSTYEKQYKELIESLEDKKEDVSKYIVFCIPTLEEGIKKIANYYKIEYIATTLMDKDTIMILANKETYYPDIKTQLEQLDNQINNK